MLNALSRMCVLFLVVVSLQGCGALGLIQAVQTANSVRSGYQGYESVSMMKSVKDKTPVFKDYQVAYVSVDVQPRKVDSAVMDNAMAEAYSRSITDMAKELGLNVICKPYNQSEVEATSDALVIQVAEVNTAGVTRVMSGENIHAAVKYIDKKSAKILAEEDYKPLQGYGNFIGIMTSSAMVKMMGNGPRTADGSAPSEADQKAWADKVTKFANETSNKYPILTDEEKEMFSQG